MASLPMRRRWVLVLVKVSFFILLTQKRQDNQSKDNLSHLIFM